jgi:pimeloyl-ACP methyl ester carboxylesterase
MLPGWQSVVIANKSVDIFHPPGSAVPRYAILYLHPLGGELPGEDPTFTEELARRGWACCAPYGGQCWWLDRLVPEFDAERTPEAFLLDVVLPWMQERWQLSPQRIAVAGISMGGQGAVRLGFRHPDRCPIVASIAGAFDFHEYYGLGTPLDTIYPDRERCRQDTAILQLNPQRVPAHIWFACDPADPIWYRGNDRLHEKLQAYGLPHQADLTTTAGGHTWDYFEAMTPVMFRFVAEAFQRESRRLL